MIQTRKVLIIQVHSTVVTIVNTGTVPTVRTVKITVSRIIDKKMYDFTF